LPSAILWWLIFRPWRNAILWNSLSCKTWLIVCRMFQANYWSLYNSNVPQISSRTFRMCVLSEAIKQRWIILFILVLSNLITNWINMGNIFYCWFLFYQVHSKSKMINLSVLHALRSSSDKRFLLYIFFYYHHFIFFFLFDYVIIYVLIFSNKSINWSRRIERRSEKVWRKWKTKILIISINRYFYSKIYLNLPISSSTLLINTFKLHCGMKWMWHDKNKYEFFLYFA
jgi:hypothetical protein